MITGSRMTPPPGYTSTSIKRVKVRNNLVTISTAAPSTVIKIHNETISDNQEDSAPK